MTFALKFEKRLREISQRKPFEFPESTVPDRFRPAAVLMPFWFEDDTIKTAMIKRPDHMRAHPGQVAFPGGRRDDTDPDFQYAALRETHEEVGVHPDDVEVLGRLDDAWSGAQHHVVPFIGWISSPPSFIPNKDEVAELYVADVEPMIQPDAFEDDVKSFRDVTYNDRFFAFPGGKVTGLSASFLIELFEWMRGSARGHGETRLKSLGEWIDRGWQ